MAIAQVAHPQPGGPAPAAPAAPPRRGRKVTPYLLLLPGMLWLAVFFATPILSLAGTSLQTRVPGTVNQFVQTFRFANYLDYAREYAPQFGRSFLYAGIATLLALAISYPLAYLIAFRAGRWRNLLLVLVVAPFFCSFILRTLAWKQILADGGFVVETLKTLHVLGQTQSLTATPFAVVAGITYNFLPFMTLPLYSSLERVDPRLHEAGYDLYGNGFTVLRKVTFPLSMPGVVAGTLLTFIPAAGDYVNATLLGRQPKTQMVGNVIQARFFGLVDYPAAATLSFILMAAILVLVLLYIRRAGTEELV
jgi:spermidine/putrescine transport system permease protein